MPSQPNQNPRMTHVSLIAEDVDKSAEFYESVIGAERISTPQFGKQEDFHADEAIPLQMLRIGDIQLHLWNDPARETEAIQFAHFGVHVDDFEDVYRRAKARDAFAAIGDETAPPQVFDFNGTAQMYLRDPTGNLLEVDYPNIDALNRSVFANVVKRETSGSELGVYSEDITKPIS